MDIRKVPGISLTNQATGEVIYTLPSGENVIRDLLSNWQAFLHNQDDVDPLIKMVMAHYQFEAIHPFIDGNGRTGCMLNILYLFVQRTAIQKGSSSLVPTKSKPKSMPRKLGLITSPNRY
ncbi:Fic family protein [Shewanella litoralis]